jgi:hypothetical protein
MYQENQQEAHHSMYETVTENQQKAHYTVFEAASEKPTIRSP